MNKEFRRGSVDSIYDSSEVDITKDLMTLNRIREQIDLESDIETRLGLLAVAREVISSREREDTDIENSIEYLTARAKEASEETTVATKVERLSKPSYNKQPDNTKDLETNTNIFKRLSNGVSQYNKSRQDKDEIKSLIDALAVAGLRHGVVFYDVNKPVVINLIQNIGLLPVLGKKRLAIKAVKKAQELSKEMPWLIAPYAPSIPSSSSSGVMQVMFGSPKKLGAEGRGSSGTANGNTVVVPYSSIRGGIMADGRLFHRRKSFMSTVAHEYQHSADMMSKRTSETPSIAEAGVGEARAWLVEAILAYPTIKDTYIPNVLDKNWIAHFKINMRGDAESMRQVFEEGYLERELNPEFMSSYINTIIQAQEKLGKQFVTDETLESFRHIMQICSRQRALNLAGAVSNGDVTDISDVSNRNELLAEEIVRIARKMTWAEAFSRFGKGLFTYR